MDRVETHIGTVAYRRAGAGAPLVLLHGGLSDGRSWTPQLESLAHDYNVVAWDAPGCGGSADPAGDLRLADYADAVAALVRALGVGPVHLAGHSFGAGLAIDVYGRHRQLVRSLVLSGAYAGWRGSLPPAEVEARLNRALAELERPPAEWVDFYLAGFFGRSVPPETVEAAHAMMLDVRAAGDPVNADGFRQRRPSRGTADDRRPDFADLRRRGRTRAAAGRGSAARGDPKLAADPGPSGRSRRQP